MDSWTLQGDSYSFLRSAPRTFTLCHRDGTPNHVEIFDIINVPNQSSAISETTCLCDIFGDDCESTSLSSSPAVGAIVPPQRDVEETAAASPLVDDLNDSSGSYHTAQGSSEGEEGFEDSRERLYSPVLQSESTQEGQPESRGHPKVSLEGSPNLESKGKFLAPQLSAGSPSSEVHNTGERNPSPACNTSNTHSPVTTASTLSSSSIERRCSPSPPNATQAYSEAEPGRITPTFKDKYNNPLDQCSTPNPSPVANICTNDCSESANSASLAEYTALQDSQEPRSGFLIQRTSPSCEPTALDLDFSELNVRSKVIPSSPFPSSSSRALSPNPQDSTDQSPVPNSRSDSPDTQASSPFPELRGRISLPDLFSRGSTPDIESSTHTPELRSSPFTAERYSSISPQSQNTRLSAEPISTVSTPAPRHTPPSPIISIATYTEPLDRRVESDLENKAPSPSLSSTASLAKTWSRTPSPSTPPRITHIPTQIEIRGQLSSPVISYSLSPSPEITRNYSPIQVRNTALSPEIRITASSPEVSRKEWPSEVKLESASPPQVSHCDSASSRSLNSSPHITGICYSVIQPEDRVSPPFPELLHLTPTEPYSSLVSPEVRSPTPSRDSLQSSEAESTGTPRGSPHISIITDSSGSVLPPEDTVSHQPRYQTPSPKQTHHTPSPGPRYQTPSPKQTHHTPSPGPRYQTPSPKQNYHTLSPEPRYQTISPRPKHHTPSPEPRYQTISPKQNPHTPSPEPRYPTPSPKQNHHTPSPEPQLQTPSPKQNHHTPSPEPRYPTPSPKQNHHTPSPEPQLQTLSPRPKHHTPSPEQTYQTPSSENYQSLLPEERSQDQSPVVPSLQDRHQHSPANLSLEYNPHCKQPTSPLRETPDVKENLSLVDIRENDYPTHLGKGRVSPSFVSAKKEGSVVVESKSSSPLVAVHSPSTISPDGKVDSSLKQPNKEIGASPNEEIIQENLKKQAISPTLFQREDCRNRPHTEIESPSLKRIGSQTRTSNISAVHKATLNSPLQGLENPHLQFTNNLLTFERNSSMKSASTPGQRRKRIPAIVKSENKERFTEDMAHHVHRRRTPSPPLTRFTPVHIIAPEKPYRQWQNRSRSPSQAVASPPSGNLKKVVTNRESPNVAPVDGNSQAQWVRLGTQLDMERDMQLEEDREVERERLRLRDREMEREQKREEQVPEKGKGWQGDASYRGEQVELSFNARNRKGPVSRRAAPTSREIRQGLPTAHSYSESLLATRRLQQHSLLASQQDARGVGPNRRLQPAAPQNKNTAPGRVAANRPCRSSSSSMGSELDETDNEVKWFTDVAFSSLSSPEIDYLDMYNSSHRSSTNISQPSTQESPAGVNPPWPAYADFRGSAQKLDNDELSFQQPYAYYSDGLDPSRRYEMGSFECVDVVVERDDSRKIRRGVPKRQIQLKRKNNVEGMQDESSENSSPGVPVMADSPSLDSHFSDAFVTQDRAPPALQECYPSESSPEPNQHNECKSHHQKATPLDESCTKTKMATCLIKSVLSKKMQSADKQPNEQDEEEGVSPTFEVNSPPTKDTVSLLQESPKPVLSSSLQSDCSISSESLLFREEPVIHEEANPTKTYGVKSSLRPSSSNSSRSVNFSQTESEDGDSRHRNATSFKSEDKSEFKVPCDSKQSRDEVQQVNNNKTWAEKEGGESANANAGNTGAPPVTRASNPQARTTNRDQECETTEDHKLLQQGDKGAYTSNTQENTLRAQEKKKASLNVCLTPEAENKPEDFLPDMSFAKTEESVETGLNKTEEEDGNGNNQVKVPIHKVRDVRRLVKNTYNLSFKATGGVTPSTVSKDRIEQFNEERRDEVKEEHEEEVTVEGVRRVKQEPRKECVEERKEELRVERKEELKEEVSDSNLRTLSSPLQSRVNPLPRTQPMQIEYKAVCCKEDKNKMICTKEESENLNETLLASPKCTMDCKESELSSNAKKINLSNKEAEIVSPCHHDSNMPALRQEVGTTMDRLADAEGKPVMVRTDRKPPMLGSLPRQSSKDREVSTAVVLIRDGSSSTKTTASSAPEDISSKPKAQAASPLPGPATPGSSSHSVSMLLKEKGYQADIGAVVGDNQNAAGGKGVPRKHVNSLEIPLQTTAFSDGPQLDSRRERTFSSSSTTSGPSAVCENTDIFTKTKEDEVLSLKPPVKDTAKQKSASPQRTVHEQTQPPTKQKELGDFEAIKRLDPTFPPRSPAIRRFRPQPIEVKSLSKETQKQDTPTNSAGNNRPQTIEVKSIAKNSQKPAVPPKPSCKFKPADLGAMANETQKPSTTTSAMKPQGEERSQTIVVSSPTIYRKISNDPTSTTHGARKLAVSAVSSIKPPPCKTTATTITSLSNQSTGSSVTETATDKGQPKLPETSPQSSSFTQTTTTASAQTSTTGPGLTSDPSPASEPNANQVPAPAPAGTNQPIQPAVMDPDIQQPPRMAYTHGQAMPVAPNKAKQPNPVSTTQVPGYTQRAYNRSFSSERSQRTEDLHFYASDDPPSYDERESFSPLMLQDLTTRRSNRYQPSSRPPPCSCTTSCPSHPGLTPPHHHHSPHNLTPPAPTHSPGQAMPYSAAQPPLRPHQSRSDSQPMSYQPGSPKSSPLGPGQPLAMYPPLQHPPPCPPCPPHPSLMHACPADRVMQPPQHIDPRRAPVHRSPQQQQPQGMAGAPYNDPVHGHSPGLPPMDPQYLCGPQSMGPSYGSEYGGDTSSLYSESSFGQAPRRVLLDPETGKYFYIEVPVQPLRKMLFDPETGQYVEVLIPQQAMSHSGLYPPSAAPYPPIHNPNMYATASQYMPYAAPAHQAHPQAQPQPPRYPETSAPGTMHPSGPGISYRNPSAQGSKPEPQNHPPLDQSYLESMYYVPTGMNASPNPTPPDYYHKHPPNLPPPGGKRS